MNKEQFEKGILQIQEKMFPDEVEWKTQTKPNDKSMCLIVPYLKKSTVHERFDKAFGPAGWQNTISKVDGGFLCKISIRVEDQWITKEDGAGETQIEGFKGGISDSLKRTANRWGLGDDLMHYPKVFCFVKQYGRSCFIPEKQQALLDKLVEKHRNGEVERSEIFLNE